MTHQLLLSALDPKNAESLLPTLPWGPEAALPSALGGAIIPLAPEVLLISCNKRVTIRHKETLYSTLGLRESAQEGPTWTGCRPPWRGWASVSSGREVGRINQTGAPSGTAEQTASNPLQCGQEAGTRHGRRGCARGVWAPRGRGPQSAGCAEGSGARGGASVQTPAAGGLCCGCTGPWFRCQEACRPVISNLRCEVAERSQLWPVVRADWAAEPAVLAVTVHHVE